MRCQLELQSSPVQIVPPIHLPWENILLEVEKTCWVESWGAHAHGPWNEEGCIAEDVDVYVAMSLPALHHCSVREEWLYGRAGSLVGKWEGWDWEKMGSTQVVEPTETCVVDLGPSQMTPLFLRCLGPFEYASMAVLFLVFPRLTFAVPPRADGSHRCKDPR